MTASDGILLWRLRHAWRSDSDLAALAACARRLASHGITFADAAPGTQPDAVKQHGFEMLEALGEGADHLVDLREVAHRQRWRDRVDPRAWRFMLHGDAVFGIPIGLHRSNCLWTSLDFAAQVGASDGLAAWMRAASARIASPLVVGREPWQIGLLFETLFAAQGEAAYRRALVDLDPQSLAGDACRRVLGQLSELREHVDERLWDMPWRDALARVAAGRAGAMVMGDWARASRFPGLAMADLRGATVHIVDFFTPLAGGADAVSHQAAALLTDSALQREIAGIKGCAPAVGHDAIAASSTVSLPSLTFDQCCGMKTKQALLQVVADHFLRRRPADESAQRLASLVAP